MTDDIEGRAVFAENLRAVRRAHGLSQSKVARASGVEQRHVSAIERRRSNFTLDTAAKLAAGLNVPLWLLLKPDGEAVVREPGRRLRNSRRGSVRAAPEEGANHAG
jgi:transcriptional regulator with XRE-family HTH domain